MLSEEEFGTYRQFGSRLEGHPTPSLPWVDVATGSLGQGLPIGVGMALAGKRLDRLPSGSGSSRRQRDGEELDVGGSRARRAYELDNLTAIVDVNWLGQRGETMHGWDLSSYSDRLRAFGWHAIEIDGHDVEQIDAAYREAESTSGKPTAIVAKTLKEQGTRGRGPGRLARQGGGERQLRNSAASGTSPWTSRSRIRGAASIRCAGLARWPRYEMGSKVATRKAYGEAL